MLAIAERLGIERPVVYSCMNDLGLRRRTASEANRIRMSRMTPKERQELAANAHAATRNFVRNERTRIRIAEGIQRSRKHIGAFEAEVGEYLTSQGVEVVSQMAWDGYNLDFFIPARRTAVEVYTSAYRPASISNTAKKTMKLLSAGVSVIDLWINRKTGEIASTAMLDELIACINVACPLPSGRGQYRVIRGQGDYDPISERYLDDLADVAVRYRSLDPGRQDTG